MMWAGNWQLKTLVEGGTRFSFGTTYFPRNVIRAACPGGEFFSPDLYEAARIEGANAWDRFWRITLPMLRPTILLVVILATIRATQAFETILLLTDGGPGGATRLVVQNMYLAAFGRLQPGYGVAQAVILFPVIMFVAWLQMRLFKQEGII